MSYLIFLVEDHPVMREAYINAIDAEPDFELTGAAATAEEALEALSDGVSCDLVVADLRLPGMSGIDLVSRLRDARPRLPVLVVSAHEEEVYVRRAREAGAAGFLPKREVARGFAASVRATASAGGASPDGASPDPSPRA